MKRKWKGQITVFLSGILMVVLSVILAACYSVRVAGEKAVMESSVDASLLSTFAEYDQDLLEEYELFFLTDQLQAEQIENRILTYIKDQYEVSELTRFRPIQFLQGDIKSVKMERCILATDEKGLSFRNQAVDYMKTSLLPDIVSGLVQSYNTCSDGNSLQEDYQTASTQVENDIETEYQKAQEEEEATQSEPVEVEPTVLDTLQEVKKGGLLELLLPKDKNVSPKTIKKRTLPSRRELKKGDGEDIRKESENQGIVNQVLFHEYVLKKFGTVMNAKEQNRLDYEVEYILWGKDKDKENLKITLKKILWLREGFNYAYLLTDSQKKTQAGTLALSIATSLGMPFLEKLLEHALLLGWAYGESILDVRALMEGEKIPTWKSKDSWQLSLEQLGNIKTLDSQKEKTKKGLSYEDYLRILLQLNPDPNRSLKCLDLIEANMRIKKGRTDFKLDSCLEGIQINAQVLLPGGDTPVSMIRRFQY